VRVGLIPKTQYTQPDTCLPAGRHNSQHIHTTNSIKISYEKSRNFGGGGISAEEGLD
jgi:hypothetical protein